MDFAGIDFVEKLHQDEGVENYSVVFGGWGVERGVSAAVDVKQLLSCKTEKGFLKGTKVSFKFRMKKASYRQKAV